MVDHAELLKHAATWMNARGWRNRLAKRRGYEQSLLEHSLIELDVLLTLLPTLSSARHYGLTQDEQNILTIAVPLHDVGKETDRWQAYVRDEGEWVPHIIPELTAAVVPDLCAALGLAAQPNELQGVMGRCSAFHHNRPGRSDSAIIEAILDGGSDRILTLASIVKAIDHFCSAASAVEAVRAGLDDPSLGKHLLLSRHELTVRGVSSTFVHRAAQVAYEKLGWKPLLYFANATVYSADATERPTVPALDGIVQCLKEELDAALAHDVSAIMVGSPTGNILPKPDLLSFKESREYLETASRKIGLASFRKKKLKDKRKVVEAYWKLKGRNLTPTDEQVEEEAGRISEAQPEMLVFKFFKAMIDPEKVPQLNEQAVAIAETAYQGEFGAGSWKALQSTSTLMAAKDMANTVDLFWALSGKAVGLPEVNKVEQLPAAKRSGLLIGLLDEIAKKVYAAAGNASPRELLSERMAAAFGHDLTAPFRTADVRELAARQLDHYAKAKPFAGTEGTKAIYFCPICNGPFDPIDGKKASADFIANPQTHTNRANAHGQFGYIMVCASCYYERLLVRIMLGKAPAEIVILMPRLNIGRERARRFVTEVRTLVEGAKGIMLAESGRPDSGFSLGFVDQIARRLSSRDPSMLSSEEMISLFSYRFTDDTQKKRRAEALKRLKEEFGNDLSAANLASDQSFQSWEEAVDALLENKLDQQEFRAIRRDAFRLYETIHLICQTPNLIFVPLSYEVAGGDSEADTDKGLRRLYVSILLSLAFDARVAIQKEGEPVDFEGAGGGAYVPPIPAVRGLVHQDWLSIQDATRWLHGIGAASLLARDTGFPVRSSLFQTLSADPPERLARRIEENWQSQGQSRVLSPDQISQIETIAEVAQRRTV
jgi:hypothetical protein